MFLKIGLLRQAAKSFCKADRDWWYGLIGMPWAEEAVLRDLVFPITDGLRMPALNWWPSLVAHFQFKSQENAPAFANLWGRWTSKSSPVLQWVMEQLKAESSKALDLLDDEARSFLGKIPQILNKSFKLELLKSLAQRLPSSGWLESYQVPGFLMNFGANAVDGVIPFLLDKQLGEQAARSLWNWAPDTAEHLLNHDNSLDINAKRNLINECHPDSVTAAIESLQRDKNILNSGELKSWVQLRLPNAGIHATGLLGLIAAV